MNPIVSIRDQACPNSLCTPGSGNNRVLVHSRKNQRLQCSNCGKTWVAHRNSINYRLRYSEAKVNEAVQLLKFGVSIRIVANRLRVSPSTVQRWQKRVDVAE